MAGGILTDYSFHHCERSRKRNRKVLQDHDAYPVYHYPHTGCLLGHSAGSRCRYRIPAQARL